MRVRLNGAGGKFARFVIELDDLHYGLRIGNPILDTPWVGIDVLGDDPNYAKLAIAMIDGMAKVLDAVPITMEVPPSLTLGRIKEIDGAVMSALMVP